MHFTITFCFASEIYQEIQLFRLTKKHVSFLFTKYVVINSSQYKLFTVDLNEIDLDNCKLRRLPS